MMPLSSALLRQLRCYVAYDMIRRRHDFDALRDVAGAHVVTLRDICC